MKYTKYKLPLIWIEYYDRHHKYTWTNFEKLGNNWYRIWIRLLLWRNWFLTKALTQSEINRDSCWHLWIRLVNSVSFSLNPKTASFSVHSRRDRVGEGGSGMQVSHSRLSGWPSSANRGACETEGEKGDHPSRRKEGERRYFKERRGKRKKKRGDVSEREKEGERRVLQEEERQGQEISSWGRKT